MAAIATHGYTITFDSTALTLTPSLLHASLGARAIAVPYGTIERVKVVSAPTDARPGVMALVGTGHALTFPPGEGALVDAAVEAITAALSGQIPEDVTPQIPGLSFVAIDVETANSTAGSMCQVAAVRVIDGRIQDSWHSLVRPHPDFGGFDPAFEEIHGISEADVAAAPTVADITAHLVDFVGPLPVVAHNVHFDMTQIAAAWKAYRVEPPRWEYACSLAASRRAGVKLANYRLPTVASFLDVPAFDHHDALADARASAEIFLRLARRASLSGSLAEVFAGMGFQLGYLDGYRPHPVMTVSKAVSAAPKKSRWAATATPDVIPEPNADADPQGPLFGQVVVLSGEFTPYDKGELWSLMAATGAQVAKNVTKKTTVLIVGAWQSKTSKHKRAEELIAAGQAIELWEASTLYRLIGLAEPQP